MTTLTSFLTRPFRRMPHDESGAITVDFVVLTSAVIVMVLALFTVLTEAVFENAAVTITNDITASGNR